MLLHDLQAKKLINPPHWMPNNMVYMTIMGSSAYGIASDDSDRDMYGVCIPPKEMTFPHLAGEIPGFGKQTEVWKPWQQHHVLDKDSGIEYDFAVYGLPTYFNLLMQNNPNIIDSIFVPRNCITFSTQVGEIIRENRHKFLHRDCWAKFKGYAYSQMHKIKTKINSSNPKRAANIEKFGYDLKFASHAVRLLNEVEQILVEQTLDLQKNNEQLKSIRRGDWTIEELEAYVTNKELALETAYANSKLPVGPNEDELKAILMNCLEAHYGDLSTAVSRVPQMDALLNDLSGILEKYKVR